MSRRKSSVRKKSVNRQNRSTPLPIVVRTPPGFEKFSEVLLRFAQPLLRPYPGSVEELQDILALAALAWNLSFLPPRERAAQLREPMRAMPFITRIMISLHLRTLIKRKESQFVEYPWRIIDFHVSESDRGFNVEVMAELGVV